MNYDNVLTYCDTETNICNCTCRESEFDVSKLESQEYIEKLDTDKLKADQVVTSEKITGDYDLICSSLYMRWSGDDVITATTTTNDEYEIELWGSSLDASVSSVGSLRMTRN